MAITNPMRDFLDEEFYPTIFENLDKVFPDMKFIKRGENWISSIKRDGSESLKDKDESRVEAKHPRNIWFQAEQKFIDILDFYIEKYNKDWYEAVTNISGDLKLQVPEREMSEETKYIYRERQRQKTLQNILVDSLFTEDGKIGLKHLINERQLSIEQIKKAGFGWVTPQTQREFGLQYYNMISIPIKQDGKIISYQYRAADRKDYKNSTGFKRGDYLINANKVELKQETKGIIIVEGILDGIIASVKGNLKNVVSLGGCSMTDTQLKQLFNYGVKSVYLLLDNDEAGREGVSRIAPKLEENGFTVYICDFPEGYKDVDEFLRNPQHTPEMLENLVYSGQIYSFYQLNNAIIKYNELKERGRDSEAFEIYISDVYDILDKCDSLHREMILKSAIGEENPDSRKAIEKALREESQKRIATKEQEKNRQLLNSLLIEAQQNSATINPDLIIERLENGIREIRKNKSNDIANKYLIPRSREEQLNSYGKKVSGIPTVFEFGTNSNNREKLYLPADALTLIGGKSSHGKSRLMINLAMQMAYENEHNKIDGRILYFCFEENQETVEQKFINNFCGIPLNRNANTNLKCIADYYKPKEERKWHIAPEKYDGFKRKEESFYYTYLGGENPKLQIINDSRDVFDIIKIITGLNDKIKGGIKAVFIDYIQLLNINGFRGERYAELKVIIEALNALANAEKIPVIFGSQLKTGVVNIADFEIENASDASDLGKSTDTAIFLWDSAQVCASGKNSDWVNSQRKIELEKADFIAGETKNKLYMQIVKCRNGIRNSYCIAQIDPQLWRVMPSEYSGKGNSRITVEMYGETIDFNEIASRYE